MKRILTLIAILIAGTSAFTGCQKYEFSPTMTAAIDSMAFTSNGKKNVLAHVDSLTHNPQLVIVTGTSDVYTPGTSFIPVIILTTPNIVGNYTIDTNNKTRSAMVYTVANGSKGTVAVSGQISVTGISDGKIQGTFTLTCADGTTIKNGAYVAIESYY